MTEPDVTRKVRQLGNDVSAIYATLDRVEQTQQEHTVAIAGVRHAVSEVRGVQMRQPNRLDELDASVAEIGVTLTRHGVRLDDIEGRFDGLETRFDGLEAKVSSMDSKLDKVLERIG